MLPAVKTQECLNKSKPQLLYILKGNVYSKNPKSTNYVKIINLSRHKRNLKIEKYDEGVNLLALSLTI